MPHTCDVYHIVREDTSPGYSLPGSPKFSYPDGPDITGQTCSFNTKGGSRTVTQREPQANFESRVKLVYPLGVDIRLNDKIVDLSNGVEYIAEVPRNIRDHHMFVMCRRTTAQEPIGDPYGPN
jgi:hypothetical protein